MPSCRSLELSKRLLMKLEMAHLVEKVRLGRIQRLLAEANAPPKFELSC